MNPPEKPSNNSANGKQTFPAEYSAREVSPPALLLQQVLRAHRIFLLHHGPDLDELFSRLQRARFCNILKRFWDDFVWNWDVLLHGNPTVDIFDGLKLAAGGELGIGVGEEEWGSGEREVLEGFVGRTEGLVDLVVSRFGQREANLSSDRRESPLKTRDAAESQSAGRQGTGQDPQPSDGVIFSGTGAIARSSVKIVSSWVELLFKYGNEAYGVQQNPSSTNRRKRPKGPSKPSVHSRKEGSQSKSHLQASAGDMGMAGSYQLGIPAPIIGKISKATQQQRHMTAENGVVKKFDSAGGSATQSEDAATGTEMFMKYMTLGLYGSAWGKSSKGSAEPKAILESRTSDAREVNSTTAKRYRPIPSAPHGKTSGHFMIGLQGDLEHGDDSDGDEQDGQSEANRGDAFEKDATTSRIMLRTLHVERILHKPPDQDSDSFPKPDQSSATTYDRFRVVVYVQEPFIFTFLFELRTDSLTMRSFYRSIHHQLGPLQRPLLSSTSPQKVAERLNEASAPTSTASTANPQPIYELVYDRSNLTVHTTIPAIPEPGSASTALGGSAPWTRVEALSVHSQILNTFTSTRRHQSEVERTCKTNRGWWVVWMRLPHVAASRMLNKIVYREAFLIRKASDYVAPSAKSSGSGWGLRTNAAGSSSRWGPGKLAEGIGIDARQYIEGLVGLNR